MVWITYRVLTLWTFFFFSLTLALPSAALAQERVTPRGTLKVVALGGPPWSATSNYAEGLVTLDKDNNGSIDQWGYAFRASGVLDGAEIVKAISLLYGVNPDNVKGKVKYNGPETVKAVDFLVKMRNEYKVVPPGVTAYQHGDVADFFLSGNVDEVHILYNRFKTTISQELVFKRLLPITPLEVAQGQTVPGYVFEPSNEEVLEDIINKNLEIQIFRALLESEASEFGARMSAMDSATSNAGEMIKKLTLKYNRARQETITKELMEIIAGAEAL